ncbi:MAG: sulfurtransferase TusA family protein [Cellvibrionaceae bacterium]
MSIKYTVDARGYSCPVPLLKAREGLNNINIGECIEVITTDASSVRDFHRMVELTTHKLIAFEQLTQSYRYVLEKGAQ